jgi:exonuclease III
VQIPLNLLNHPQKLKIRSLNTTSCAVNVKLANGTKKSRLWLIKDHIITNHKSDDPIDVLCLQETAISQNDNHLHEHSAFNDHYQQFSIFQDTNVTVNRRKRGQMVLVSKHLTPQQLLTYTDTVHGTFLPIQFTHQSTTFIVVSIYINPDNNVNTTHVNVVKTLLNQLINNYPNDELIIMGDFNMSHHELRTNYINNLPPIIVPIQITSHNNNNAVTFTRGMTTSSVDHALTITQQNLRYAFSTHKDDMNGIKSEHHTLQLQLFAKPTPQQPTIAAPFFNNNPQQFPELHHLTSHYNNTLKWISTQKTQRLLMGNSYLVSSHRYWKSFIEEITTTNEHIQDGTISPMDVEKHVNEMNHLFCPLYYLY